MKEKDAKIIFGWDAQGKSIFEDNNKWNWM